MLLFVVVVHVLYVYLSRRIYLKNWITSGRATTYRRMVLVSDVWFLGAWFLVITGLLFFHFDKEEVAAFVKRMGRFSYVLVPFDIFLSLKPNPLPNVYYLEMIFLHKWLGRIIALLGGLHSAGFLIIWLVRGEGQILKMFKLENFLGVLAITGFLVSTVVSLVFFRRRFYKTFFTTHLVIAWAVVFLLQFHARPGVTLYTLLNISLIFLQIISKLAKSSDVTIEKISEPNSSLEIIQFNNIWTSGFVPGSHIRVSYPKKNPLTYLLPSHPYTIASRPGEQKIKLVVQRCTFDLKSGQTHSVFGTFPSIHPHFFKTVDRVLLIAGGSGISFVLGIYEELAKNSSVSISLVWVTRNEGDLWILKHFHIDKADIYITGSAYGEDADKESPPLDEAEELLMNDEQLVDRGSDSFELDNLDPFDDSNEVAIARKDSYRSSGHIIKYGRPDLTSYASKFSDYDKANDWVISCGSKSLNKSSQSWAKSMKLRFYSEAYAL
jgi:NAD(P)H-flavin reductase